MLVSECCQSNFSPVKTIAVASLTDRDINTISANYAEKKVRGSKIGKMQKAIFPVCLALLTGITIAKTPGKLSGKLLSAGAFGATVLAGSKIIEGYSKTADKMIDSSEKTQEVVKKHPLLASLGIVGGMVATAFAGFAFMRRIPGTIDKVLPKLSAQVKGVWTNVANSIDKSKLSQKAELIKGAFASFAEKHPKLAENISRHNTNAVLLGTLGSIVAVNNKRNAEKGKIITQTQQELYEARETCRETIDTIFETK